MGLASFLSRLTPPAAPAGPAEEERLRTRARQRLIGAALLVLLAVLLLPWVFDSPPRPLPSDLPIDIPRREAAVALGLPSERAAPETAPGPSDPLPTPAAEPVRPPPVERSTPVPPRAPEAPAARERETVEPAVTAAPAARRAASAPAAPRAPAASSAVPPKRPEPVAAGKGGAETPAPAAAKPAPETTPGARYIVQIGAYADPATARAARLKVERLGLKTYVHEIDVPGGKRIRVRVGPFSDREEAARVQDRLEKAGFQPGLLTL